MFLTLFPSKIITDFGNPIFGPVGTRTPKNHPLTSNLSIFTPNHHAKAKSATQRDQGVVASSTLEEDCLFGEMSSHFLSRDYGNLYFSDFLKRKVPSGRNIKAEALVDFRN